MYTNVSLCANVCCFKWWDPSFFHIVVLRNTQTKPIMLEISKHGGRNHGGQCRKHRVFEIMTLLAFSSQNCQLMFCLLKVHKTFIFFISSNPHSGNYFSFPNTLCKCMFSLCCLSLLNACAVDNPSGHLLAIFSELHCSQRNASLARALCLFCVSFFPWEQKLPAYRWTDYPWLINLSTRACFSVRTQSGSLCLSGTGYIKIHFLWCDSLVSYFGFCWGRFSGKVECGNCLRHYALSPNVAAI